MLQDADRRRVAGTFGADDAQIERDHLISHTLGALSRLDSRHELVFFGGTALARTHLPTGRLSEDLDLYCEDRIRVAKILTTELPRLMRREFPGLRWDPPLTEVRDTEPSLLVGPDDVSLQVQLLQSDATYRRWPSEVRSLKIRYVDAEPAVLRVPTLSAFCAMKAAAWRERHTARDLYDLWALARVEAIDRGVVKLLTDVTGTPLVQRELDTVPRDLRWEAQLAHQVAELPEASECLRVVRATWAAAAGW